MELMATHFDIIMREIFCEKVAGLIFFSDERVADVLEIFSKGFFFFEFLICHFEHNTSCVTFQVFNWQTTAS